MSVLDESGRFSQLTRPSVDKEPIVNSSETPIGVSGGGGVDKQHDDRHDAAGNAYQTEEGHSHGNLNKNPPLQQDSNAFPQGQISSDRGSDFSSSNNHKMGRGGRGGNTSHGGRSAPQANHMIGRGQKGGNREMGVKEGAKDPRCRDRSRDQHRGNNNNKDGYDDPRGRHQRH